MEFFVWAYKLDEGELDPERALARPGVSVEGDEILAVRVSPGRTIRAAILGSTAPSRAGGRLCRQSRFPTSEFFVSRLDGPRAASLSTLQLVSRR